MGNTTRERLEHLQREYDRMQDAVCVLDKFEIPVPLKLEQVLAMTYKGIVALQKETV